MTTKFIGLKELRHNMATISKAAAKKKQRVIVLKKNTPLFELRPLSEDDIALWTFEHELNEARASVRKGNVHSTNEVRAMLGLTLL